jgi:hypothetical protein
MGGMAKHCRLLLPAAAAMLLMAHSSSAAAAEPFSIRGITLGLLLADFKIAPAPDRDRFPDAAAACSDEYPAGSESKASQDALRLNEAEAKAGVVRCAFLRADNGTLVPAGLLVAGAPTQAAFVFTPDRQGALRLALVQAEGDSADYDKVKAALTKRYGLPQAVIRGFAHDAAGAKLVDETARWSNGVSQIEIDQRLENQDVNRMAIEYRHEGLISEADKRLKAAGASEGDLL